MRIVFRFSYVARLEEALIGSHGPNRVEIVLNGGALFGPRTDGDGVIARQPEPYADGQVRAALVCGEHAFDVFMRNAVEQTGKPFDWFWIPACRLNGKLPRMWRNADSWSGAEMMQWLSEMAEIPILATPSDRLVTTKELALSPTLHIVGRGASSDEWERWKVWGRT